MGKKLAGRLAFAVFLAILPFQNFLYSLLHMLLLFLGLGGLWVRGGDEMEVKRGTIPVIQERFRGPDAEGRAALTAFAGSWREMEEL